MGYIYLPKRYFQYQRIIKTGRHQQSLDFNLAMETGIFAQRVTVDQGWKGLCYQERNYYFGGFDIHVHHIVSYSLLS